MKIFTTTTAGSTYILRDKLCVRDVAGLERILAGIDTVPNHAELFMALDFPVAEQVLPQMMTHHSTTASAQPAFYQR